MLNNRYQLTERVAAGGMGEVWRATDSLLGRGVAVKVLLPSLMSDSEFITRFRTEARMMAALRHPGIVQVYDYGEDAVVGGSRMDYLVMEFVEGTPLSKRIKAAGKLGVAETMGIMAQAADALQVAHEAGIVHRDVKPSNLLVRPGGAVVLVDFGVARSVGVTGITSTNVVLGSASYMAPEQAEGKPISPVTDLYALGAVAYCCLTGRPPYVGDNPLQILGQLVHGAPPTLPAEIPQAAAAVVLRALDKDSARRHPSATALADAARSAQDPGAMSRAAPQQAPPQAAPPQARQQAAAPQARQQAAPPQAVRPTPPQAVHPAPRPIGPPTSPPAGPPLSPPMGHPIPAPAGRPIAAPHPVVVARPPAAAAPAPDPRPGRNRRRTGTLAALGAALAAGLIGVIAVMALRPGSSDALTQPPNGPAGDAPVLEAGPGDAEDRPSGKPALPPVPGASRGARPARNRVSAPTSPGAVPTTAGPTATATEPAGEPTGEPPGGTGTAAPTPKPGATTKNPYTPAKACGSGFSVIDSAMLKGGDGTVHGRVYLLYSSSAGSNCTVTMKSTSVGIGTATTAYLEVKGSARKTDSGPYKYYAGPMKAKAAGVCVKWGGSAGGASYASPFEHCD